MYRYYPLISSHLLNLKNHYPINSHRLKKIILFTNELSLQSNNSYTLIMIILRYLQRSILPHRQIFLYLPHRQILLYLPHRQILLYLPHRQILLYLLHHQILLYLPHCQILLYQLLHYEILVHYNNYFHHN